MNFDGIATNFVFAWLDKRFESSRFMMRKLREELNI